jgi:hypothetical protein
VRLRDEGIQSLSKADSQVGSRGRQDAGLLHDLPDYISNPDNTGFNARSLEYAKKTKQKT